MPIHSFKYLYGRLLLASIRDATFQSGKDCCRSLHIANKSFLIHYMNMLNKTGTTSNRNIDILRNHQMTAAFVNDKYGYKLFESLCATNALGQANKNMYLPIITTRAMSYNTNDVQIKTIDKGNTYFGHMIKYGKHSEEHKVSGTISLDFRNDRFLSIMKMIYIWMCYIYIVSKTGAIEPLLKYQENLILYQKHQHQQIF